MCIVSRLHVLAIFLIICCNNVKAADHTCVQNSSYVWCIPSDYNYEEESWNYAHITNRTFPWNYHFRFDINEVQEVNDKKQTIYLDMYFYVTWFEPRLIINETALDWAEITFGPPDEVNASPETLHELWCPDLEIYGLEEFNRKEILKEMSSGMIKKDKMITYLLSVNLKISCQMNFDNFPLDSHRCPFRIGSYYGTEEIVKCTSDYQFHEKRQRSLQHSIEIEDLAPEDQTVILPTGRFAACGFTVVLERNRIQKFFQVYLTSMLFVIVSWASFMIKPDVVPGRMGLLVTLFLVLINIFNGVKAGSPQSTNLNAVDLYLLVCIFLVFGALAEYATVLFRIRRLGQRQSSAAKCLSCEERRARRAKKKSLNCEEFKTGEEFKPTENVSQSLRDKNSGGPITAWSKPDSTNNNMDSISLIVFPIIFLVFNGIYWIMFEYVKFE